MFFCAGCREPLHALHRLQCIHTLSHYDQVTFEQCGDPRSAWRSAWRYHGGQLPSSYLIHVSCTKGHKQEIFMPAAFGREYAEQMAGFFDGKSPLFVHSPLGTDSPIGKCGICSSQLVTRVEAMP